MPDGLEITEIARAEFDLDHNNREISIRNPIEARIRAISPETPRVDLAGKINSVLEIMVPLPETESHALLHHCIKPHFKLTQNEIKSYERTLKAFRKQKQEPVSQKRCTRQDLIDLLKKEQNRREINPAQDFQSGKMYFAIKINGESYLVSSDRRIMSFVEAAEEGLVLRLNHVDTARFSSEGIIKFIEQGHRINIPELYERICSYISRFVFLKDPRLTAYLALWIMGSYVFKIFRYYPYVWLNAEKQSGKSLLMGVLSQIAFNGEVIINPTQAVVFRDVSHNSISMFVDEVEQLRKQDKETHSALMSLFNSGFESNGRVKRAEQSAKGEYILKEYTSYSPKMFAGINDIDDVLQDRTICIKILRKKEGENIERYKESDLVLESQRQIRDGLYVFALENATDIARLYYDEDESNIKGMDHLANRERDIWEPIFILANMVDVGLGGNETTMAMESLSKDSMFEKQEDSVAKNETYQLLTIVKQMIEDDSYNANDKGDLEIAQESVYQYFKNTDEYSWLEKKNALTVRLKKIKVNSFQKHVDGQKRARFYKFNLNDFRDMCERFNI